MKLLEKNIKKIIPTPRLIIRQLTLEDAPFLLELLNSEGWKKFIGDRGVRTIEAAEDYLSEKYIKNYREGNDYVYYLIERKEGAASVGVCGLLKRDYLDDVDIGYALLPQFSKKGYAFEATHALMKYAIEELHLQRIIAITTFDNKKSQSLLEKLGLTYEKKVVEKEKNGEVGLMLFSFEKKKSE